MANTQQQYAENYQNPNGQYPSTSASQPVFVPTAYAPNVYAYTGPVVTMNEEVKLGKACVCLSYVIFRPVTVVCPHCGETVLTSVRSRSAKWYSLLS